ncbi:co-chaperone GroES, partial [Candidatus Gracilibacteria bacterium]|nr:co-chaperone GroES [Candidatus Gracilibacteria bacterium]
KQKEVPYIYEVIEIGPGTEKNKMTVNIGDKVLSGQYSGDEVRIDGENYKIVSIEYILGVIE